MNPDQANALFQERFGYYPTEENQKNEYPKPAPSKPLTFTPPQYLRGETQSSELPTVEGADSNVIIKQHRRADGFRNANALLATSGLPKAKSTVRSGFCVKRHDYRRDRASQWRSGARIRDRIEFLA
jgi:hypothetical protein